MAVTKLAHLKESRIGQPYRHLKHALSYILNPKKTSGGLWTGGSVPPDEKEALRCMQDVKEEFGKTYGRQGYHFVISFIPGECDEKTAFLVGREFCERYFGDEYQYVLAVHNDQAHMHCHIVFNSVSQIDGRKYRYEEGDWQKHIQPITDELCRKYHLKELVYDRDRKVSVSYAERRAVKDGKITWKDVIRADIEAAIRAAGSFQEYLKVLEGMGYRIRMGRSEKYGIYYSYTAPGSDAARRDYRLGPGYRKHDIEERIRNKNLEIPEAIPRIRPVVLSLKGTSYLQIAFIRRVRQAVDWRYFAFRRKEQARVRKDLIRIDYLSEGTAYLLEKGLRSEEEVRERLEDVKQQITAKRLQQKAAALLDPKGTPDAAEEAALQALRREKRILTRLIKEIPETECVREIPLVMDTPATVKEEVMTHG